MSADCKADANTHARAMQLLAEARTIIDDNIDAIEDNERERVDPTDRLTDPDQPTAQQWLEDAKDILIAVTVCRHCGAQEAGDYYHRPAAWFTLRLEDLTLVPLCSVPCLTQFADTLTSKTEV